MTDIIKTNLKDSAKIFNKLNREKIEEFEVNEGNFLKFQRQIVDMYRDEKKYNALKVFEIVGQEGVVDPHVLQGKILELPLKQDFLKSENYDDYSVFPHTDGDDKFCKLSFAGFTKFAIKDTDEDGNVIIIPFKRFNVFKASIFKNYKTGKIYVFLKFNNRRRLTGAMNFFTIETTVVRVWFQETFGYRLKAVDVRDVYYKHKFDTDKFEHLGYNVSDILDDKDETLPVELKFRPADRKLKPEDIYSQVNKHVLPSIGSAIVKFCEKTFGELDQNTRDGLSFEIKAMNLSKLFFESAHKAFENGVGHLKYLKAVDDYDKPVVFRFDFPAEEAGVIKLDIYENGRHMDIIYDEINRYLDAR